MSETEIERVKRTGEWYDAGDSETSTLARWLPNGEWELLSDPVVYLNAQQARIEALEKALRELAAPNWKGEPPCWCAEDYLIQLPGPRGHSNQCKEIQKLLNPKEPEVQA